MTTTPSSAPPLPVAPHPAPAPAPPPIEDLQGWLAGFLQPTIWFELAALVLCVLLAWALTALLRHALGLRENPGTVLFGRRLIDGVMFPLLLLSLSYVAHAALRQYVPLTVFQVALPVLVALLAIRVGVKVLQVAFASAPWVRTLERSISWLAWAAMVLWVSGLLPLVLDEMDRISWQIGAGTVSLRTLVEGALTAGVVLILALWVSSAIERRLLRKAVGDDLSVRKVVSNVTRALLMFLGLVLVLSAVGLDLTALSVLGGAIGVGIGFGLQRLASNYVSGFVILAERSMRIGDSVRVDNFEGRITDIKARYTVIRSLSGRESIVPNEMLVINRVENLSLADNRLWQSTLVSVAYDSDVELVSDLLQQAAQGHDRVLKDPEPAVALSNFGPDGLEFTLGYWIADPENVENDTLNIRSLINHSILQLLRQHGVEISYPQRVLHIRPTGRLPAALAEGAHESR